MFSNCSLYSIWRNKYFGFLLKLLDTFFIARVMRFCIFLHAESIYNPIEFIVGVNDAICPLRMTRGRSPVLIFLLEITMTAVLLAFSFSTFVVYQVYRWEFC